MSGKQVSDQAFLAAIVETADDAIVAKTPDGTIMSWNRAAEAMFGYSAAEAIGKPMTIIFPPDRLHEEVEFLARVARKEQVSHYETVRVRKGGTQLFVSVSLSPILDSEGRVIGVANIARDISERKRMEDLLREMARTDPLTALANRRVFTEAMEAEFRRYRRLGTDLSVLMIDIDNFKQINDLYGHDAGDRALVALAGVLNSMARATDLAARYGGEEFVVLLISTGRDGAIAMAERIRKAVAAIRVSTPGGEFAITVSIGAAASLSKDRAWSEIIARADAAMYRAKDRGRNQVAAADSSP